MRLFICSSVFFQNQMLTATEGDFRCCMWSMMQPHHWKQKTVFPEHVLDQETRTEMG